MIDLVRIFAASCSGGNFLGFPTWYKYLPGTTTNAYDYSQGTETIVGQVCTPQIHSIGDIWLIVAAILEILLRIAALAAVAFVVWGGIQYVISQGEPDKTAQARKTVINALIGLVMAVSATVLVTFFAGRFTK